MHLIYDSETLKKATEAYFQKDWGTMLEINLSMLDQHPDNEFLIWHIADTYIKLGNVEKAIEFAQRIKGSVEHKEDIMLRAAYAMPVEEKDDCLGSK